MSLSRTLVIVCSFAVQTCSTALRLERGATSSGELAQLPNEAMLVECPWGNITTLGTTSRQYEHATREACERQLIHWQFENEDRSASARLAEPSDGEKMLERQRLMGEAVRALKQKSNPVHLVFIGDSMMRQQYFNLASWMIHGKTHPSRPSQPKPVPPPRSTGQQRVGDTPGGIKDVIHDYALWKHMFSVQNQDLQGDGVSEICHCGYDSEANEKTRFVEDRFITLPENGSSISFFAWLGYWSFHGYFDPSKERPNQASCPLGDCKAPFLWTIDQARGDIAEWQNARGVVRFLRSIVMKLQPKPTHVVMNCGFWGHLTSVGLRNLFAAGAEIRERDGTRFVWKTVTHPKSDTTYNLQARVNMQKELARKYGWDVFDAYNVTRDFPAKWYQDDIHLQDPATTHLNRIYLEALVESLT